MVKNKNLAVCPPRPSEIEISLFGPSYGESVVVHAGNSNWFIIDSCFCPGTSESAPLRYLRKLGVDLENEIKGIIVTHWDHDHVRGLSQILEAAPKADVIISAAFYCEELLALLEASKQLGSDDGHSELRRVFDHLEANQRSPVLAIQNHGSKNGDCAGIWPNLLDAYPIGALAPWRLGGKLLPTRDDLTRLLQNTGSLYITAIPHNNKVKRPQETQAAIDGFAPQIYRKLDYPGQIMIRAEAITTPPEWTVELFATARKVTPLLVKALPKSR